MHRKVADVNNNNKKKKKKKRRIVMKTMFTVTPKNRNTLNEQRYLLFVWLVYCSLVAIVFPLDAIIMLRNYSNLILFFPSVFRIFFPSFILSFFYFWIFSAISTSTVGMSTNMGTFRCSIVCSNVQASIFSLPLLEKCQFII